MRFQHLLSTFRAMVLTALAFSAVSSAFAAPPKPTYQPVFTADFDNGVTGNTVQELAVTTTSAKTIYSNAVPGPFGGGKVVRQSNTADNKSFGGKVLDFPTQLGSGKEVWVRWYEYFPAGFKFANGTNGDGGSGGIKWMRFQGGGSGGGTRLTFQPLATPNCAKPCSGGLNTFTPSKVTGENVGWLLFEGRHNPVHAEFSNAKSYQTGQWLAVQVYLRLSKGDTPNGDGNGLIRVWVNEDLVGEFQRNTLPPAGHTHDGQLMKSVWWGNYWNGGFPNDQRWYMDEVIVTTDRPNTTDTSGNPFIHPGTRVADFGTTSQTAPPDPPSGIN